MNQTARTLVDLLEDGKKRAKDGPSTLPLTPRPAGSRCCLGFLSPVSAITSQRADARAVLSVNHAPYPCVCAQLYGFFLGRLLSSSITNEAHDAAT